jgi:hypothetical protein
LLPLLLPSTLLCLLFCFILADNDIMMPGLWGGPDGAGLTRELLSAGFDTAMLLISGEAGQQDLLLGASVAKTCINLSSVSGLPALLQAAVLSLHTSSNSSLIRYEYRSSSRAHGPK